MSASEPGELSMEHRALPAQHTLKVRLTYFLPGGGGGGGHLRERAIHTGGRAPPARPRQPFPPLLIQMTLSYLSATLHCFVSQQQQLMANWSRLVGGYVTTFVFRERGARATSGAPFSTIARLLGQ